MMCTLSSLLLSFLFFQLPSHLCHGAPAAAPAAALPISRNGTTVPPGVKAPMEPFIAVAGRWKMIFNDYEGPDVSVDFITDFIQRVKTEADQRQRDAHATDNTELPMNSFSFSENQVYFDLNGVPAPALKYIDLKRAISMTIAYLIPYQLDLWVPHASVELFKKDSDGEFHSIATGRFGQYWQEGAVSTFA